MKQQLITALETICPNNVYLQGTVSEDYPSDFITFWTNSTDDNSHYDNKTTSYDWQFSVIYYTNDPSKTTTIPPTIITALKNAGFIPQGKGNDIPSDNPTHTGWAMDFIYRETISS